MFGLGIGAAGLGVLVLVFAYVLGSAHTCLKVQHQATTQGLTEIAAFVKSAEACQ